MNLRSVIVDEQVLEILTLLANEIRTKDNTSLACFIIAQRLEKLQGWHK